MKGNTEPEKAYLIDASIYIFKYYFALPDNWWSNDDIPTAAVYGYTHWLFRFLKSSQPRYVAACFDESLDSCFRNEIYPAYKSSRALPDENLAYQLEACKQITMLLGIPAYASERYEADDLLGTLAVRARAKGLQPYFLTRDKDIAQLLVGETEQLWDYPDGLKLNAQGVQNKMGVAPQKIAEFLALVGDSSDDIPGVPGVGAKTAAAALNALGSWQNIKGNYAALAALPLRGAKGLAEKLAAHESQIDMALSLSTIVCKATLGRRFSLIARSPDREKLIAFGQHLGFGRRFETSVNTLIKELRSE